MLENTDTLLSTAEIGAASPLPGLSLSKNYRPASFFPSRRETCRNSLSKPPLCRYPSGDVRDPFFPQSHVW